MVPLSVRLILFYGSYHFLTNIKHNTKTLSTLKREKERERERNTHALLLPLNARSKWHTARDDKRTSVCRTSSNHLSLSRGFLFWRRRARASSSSSSRGSSRHDDDHLYHHFEGGEVKRRDNFNAPDDNLLHQPSMEAPEELFEYEADLVEERLEEEENEMDEQFLKNHQNQQQTTSDEEESNIVEPEDILDQVEDIYAKFEEKKGWLFANYTLHFHGEGSGCTFARGTTRDRFCRAK